jgi:hypothetical protein
MNVPKRSVLDTDLTPTDPEEHYFSLGLAYVEYPQYKNISVM